jgi:condensin complex subunit 1
VQVLTHLILNDMMKVKGHVSEMMLRLEDPEPRIANLAKLFVDQLAHKPGNPVYNLLPDLLSRLSAETHLPHVAFQRVMRTLLSYIDKERQADSLVERLAGRFVGTEEPAKWRDVAFCMKELPCSEKAVKKLCEHFKQFAHTLVDDEVAAHFDKLCANACRRAKPEAPLRVAAELLAAKIAEVRSTSPLLRPRSAEDPSPVSSLGECELRGLFVTSVVLCVGGRKVRLEAKPATGATEGSGDAEVEKKANDGTVDGTVEEEEEEEEHAAPTKKNARGGTKARTKAAPKAHAHPLRSRGLRVKEDEETTICVGKSQKGGVSMSPWCLSFVVSDRDRCGWYWLLAATARACV